MPRTRVGVTTVLGDAVEAIRARPSILGVVLVGGVLSLIPLVGSFLTILFSGVATGIAVRGLGESWNGDRSLAGRLLSLLGASIVAGIGVLIGTLFLVLPGIYIAMRVSLLPAEAVAGGHRAFDALSASWERTRGQLPTVFAWGVLLFGASVALTVVLFLVLSAGRPATAVMRSLGFRAAVSLLGVPISALSVGGIAAMWIRFDR